MGREQQHNQVRWDEFHPRRPRGSQSGRVKRRDKSFQAWAELFRLWLKTFVAPFLPTDRPWVSEDGRILQFYHFLAECIAFNQRSLRSLLPECIALRTTQESSVGESVHRSLFSLCQIFYSTVRGLAKFKTRRSLSDEYDG